MWRISKLLFLRSLINFKYAGFWYNVGWKKVGLRDAFVWKMLLLFVLILIDQTFRAACQNIVTFKWQSAWIRFRTADV